MRTDPTKPSAKQSLSIHQHLIAFAADHSEQVYDRTAVCTSEQTHQSDCQAVDNTRPSISPVFTCCFEAVSAPRKLLFALHSPQKLRTVLRLR
jgi:hypothetical protein